MKGLDLLSINPTTNETRQLVSFRWEGEKLVVGGDPDLAQDFTDNGVRIGGNTYKISDGDDFLRAVMDKYARSTRRTTKVIK